MRVAIVAEVLALRKIAVERDYHAGLVEMGHQLLVMPEDERSKASLQVRISQHYCRVYVANLGKLGYLSPEDAQLVVSFYQFVDSVVQDVIEGGIIYEGTNSPEAFKETANVLQFALDAAQLLADRHVQKQPSPDREPHDLSSTIRKQKSPADLDFRGFHLYGGEIGRLHITVKTQTTIDFTGFHSRFTYKKIRTNDHWYIKMANNLELQGAPTTSG